MGICYKDCLCDDARIFINEVKQKQLYVNVQEFCLCIERIDFIDVIFIPVCLLAHRLTHQLDAGKPFGVCV